MTETTEQELPWRTARWTPLEPGDWAEGTTAEYVCLVGTAAELAAEFGGDASGQALRTAPSGFVARSPYQHGRDWLAEEQERRPAVADQLVALVWDAYPAYRWDGARNRPDDPDHALSVVVPPGTRRTRSALLARFQAAHAQWRLREAAMELWEETGDIALVHRATGLARTTVYRLLRAAGYEPTDR